MSFLFTGAGTILLGALIWASLPKTKKAPVPIRVRQSEQVRRGSR